MQPPHTARRHTLAKALSHEDVAGQGRLRHCCLHMPLLSSFREIRSLRMAAEGATFSPRDELEPIFLLRSVAMSAKLSSAGTTCVKRGSRSGRGCVLGVCAIVRAGGGGRFRAAVAARMMVRTGRPKGQGGTRLRGRLRAAAVAISGPPAPAHRRPPRQRTAR